MILISAFLEFRQELWRATLETLYMTGAGLALSYALGAPLGAIIVLTAPGGLWQNKWLNVSLGLLTNAARSVPFIIMLILVVPFTRFLVGTMLGATAALVPLVIGAAPFVARLVEASLNEVDKGVIEAARAMGASGFQITRKVMFPECAPSLIRGIAISAITLMSFSAMAGVVGAGGLGHLAFRWGHERGRADLMLVTVIIIIALTALIQFALNTIARIIDKS